MTTVTTTAKSGRRRERHNLLRHFAEMVLAMMAGMAVLGVVARVICAALGQPGFFLDHPGLRAPLMAMNMTIGMAVWMRHRGHGRAPIAEMSAAMFVPVAVLIVPFWAGVFSGETLLSAMHVLMFPAMVIAMLHRREEYAQDHQRHIPSGTTASVAYERARPSERTERGDEDVRDRVAGVRVRGQPAQLMAHYDKELERWPVPFEAFFVDTRYGTTHVGTSGDPASPLLMTHPIGRMRVRVVLDPRRAE